MACSRFEYVKKFEDDDRLLPGCWVAVRLDGRGFTKFCKTHAFQKPNDERALHLMNSAAATVMKSFSDVVLAYGQSDEYSFVFRRETALFNRRKSKILSCVVSLFSSAYSAYWPLFLKGKLLQTPPSFDGRIVLYPTTAHLRDYLSWRQADVHVNNLFNTTFWALVNTGVSPMEAEKRLKGTLSGEKNEILFSEFGINYNNENPMFRKGSVIIRREHGAPVIEGNGNQTTSNEHVENHDVDKEDKVSSLFDGLSVSHEDIIAKSFWDMHSSILYPPDANPPRIRC